MMRRQPPFRVGEDIWTDRGIATEPGFVAATVIGFEGISQRAVRAVGVRYGDDTGGLVPAAACHRDSPQFRLYRGALDRWLALRAQRDARCERDSLPTCVQACRETPEATSCEMAYAEVAAAREVLFAVHPWGRRPGRQQGWDEDM